MFLSCFDFPVSSKSVLCSRHLTEDNTYMYIVSRKELQNKMTEKEMGWNSKYEINDILNVQPLKSKMIATLSYRWMQKCQFERSEGSPPPPRSFLFSENCIKTSELGM